MIEANKINDRIYKQHLAVCEEIFRGEECRIIFLKISDHAQAINESSYGPFFASVQDYAVHRMVLAVHNIFDSTKTDKPKLSIPEIIRELPAARLFNPTAIIDYLKDLGKDCPESVQATNLSKIAQTYLEQVRPTTKSSERLQRVANYRNTWVAHRQDVVLKEQSGVKIEDIDWCLDWAKGFIIAIANGYLGTHCGNDVKSFYTSNDAGVSALCMKRILEDLHVVKERHDGGVERRRRKRIERLKNQ
ncbi:MAG: hypothetical protein AB7S92_06090 [Parvibaculaceae bacterium]